MYKRKVKSFFDFFQWILTLGHILRLNIFLDFTISPFNMRKNPEIGHPQSPKKPTRFSKKPTWFPEKPSRLTEKFTWHTKKSTRFPEKPNPFPKRPTQFLEKPTWFPE